MGSPIQDSKMGVPEAVLEKVGSLPDIASMSKEDLSALVKQLYERSCAVFGEKFDEEYQVKKRDMEIHNLEMETSESHGTFKIPKLKKVNKFKKSLEEFMKVVIPQAYRAPEFAPEPPVFDNEMDTISAAETPFEVYVYLKAFRSQANLAEYLKFFATFTDTSPAFQTTPTCSPRASLATFHHTSTSLSSTFCQA